MCLLNVKNRERQASGMRFALGLLLTVCVVTTGCATSYGSAGYTGGYSESKVNDRLIKVDFYGNGFITADKVQSYGLYRCAELARDAKKPYFVIFDSLRAAAVNAPSSAPRVGTLGGKPVAFSFMMLEDSYRPGAQETNAVIDRLKPVIEAGQTPAGDRK